MKKSEQLLSKVKTMLNFRMNINSLVYKLIILALFLTPFLNLYEQFAIINGKFNQVQAETPVYIKILKDSLMLTIIALTSILVLKRFHIRKIHYLYIFFLFFIFFSFILSILHQNIATIVAGLRWSLPIILIFCFANLKISDSFQKKIAHTLVLLLFIGIFIQIYQLFYFPDFWGSTLWRLNLRNPGFFSIPQTMAFFTLIVVYYTYTFLDKSVFRNSIIYFFAPLSIF